HRCDLSLRDPDFHSPSDEAGVQRIVVGVNANVRIGGHPRHPPPVDVGLLHGKLTHHLELLGEPVDRPGAQRLVGASVGLLEPNVELQLEVEVVREVPAGLEVALHIPLQTLDRSLRLRVRRRAEIPVETQLPTEPGISIGRASTASVQTPLPVPHHQLRQRADRPQAAGHTPQHIRCFLGEDQRASASTGIAETAHDDPRPAGLTVTDWHRPRGLPQIPLADLPRPIDGPLVRAGALKQRAHLPQIVINDRLAAIEPERLDQFPNPDTGQRWLAAQQLPGLFPERVGRRPPLRTTKPRRRLRSQRRADRVARQTRAAHQLLDRDPANEVLPAQLGPLLHVQHAPSPGLDNTIEPGSPTPRTPPPPPEGVKSQPAKRGQSPTGADTIAILRESVKRRPFAYAYGNRPKPTSRVLVQTTRVSEGGRIP